jgi:two-component system LytT family response regulator
MNTRLRGVVVDDEPIAVQILVQLLRETGRVEVVGTALDPEQALAFPGWTAVDVAFLDILMPIMNGIELARRLPGDTMVVFVTGYDQYALQAFEVHAVDYLLKPVTERRLLETLDVLERRQGDTSRRTARMLAEEVTRHLQGGTGPGATGRIERVGGRVGEDVHIFDVTEITHFMMKDRLVYAVTASKDQHVVDQSMDELERRLDPGRFMRIHRGCIVSLAHTQKIPGHFRRDPVLRLRNGTELDVARDRVGTLKQRLGLRRE